MRRQVLSRLAAVLVLAAALSQPAYAQTNPGESVRQLPPDTTYPEFQGLGCIAGGTATALAVVTYVELAAAAAVVGVAPPFIVATGFAFGCSVGALMAPGLWWIYRHL